MSIAMATRRLAELPESMAEIGNSYEKMIFLELAKRNINT